MLLRLFSLLSDLGNGCFGAAGVGMIAIWFRVETFVGSLVLFHVILASECFVANGTVDTLLSSVLFAVAGCVT